MTNIDETGIIETISVKKNTVYLTLMEQRPWNSIKNAKQKLTKKIRSAKKYMEKEEFKKKFAGMKIIIEFYTIHKPPQRIKDLLKKEGVEYRVFSNT